jgi:hypothetical protein
MLTWLQAVALREIVTAGCATTRDLRRARIASPVETVGDLARRGLIRTVGDPVAGEQLWEATPEGFDADLTGA